MVIHFWSVVSAYAGSASAQVAQRALSFITLSFVFQNYSHQPSYSSHLQYQPFGKTKQRIYPGPMLILQVFKNGVALTGGLRHKALCGFGPGGMGLVYTVPLLPLD